MTNSVLEKQGYHISALGDFRISGGNRTLTEEDIHSDIVTKILGYIIMHDQMTCTVQELTDLFWPEDTSGNPAGALKNVMYRVRKMLQKVWPDENFIVTIHGGYQWNPNVPVTVDLYEMQALAEKADEATDCHEKMALIKDAIRLYRGKFLSSFTTEHWVMGIQEYIHSRYLEVIKSVCEHLKEKEMYDEMEKIVASAIAVEPTDDALHCFAMEAFIGEGRLQLAQEHYRYAKQLLNMNLGVRPSVNMQELYHQSLKQMNMRQMTIDEIRTDLVEDETETSFIVDYGVFKQIYNLELRRNHRSDLTVFLGLITVGQAPQALETETARNDRLNAMRYMREILERDLRTGDLVTCCGSNQYLVMLLAHSPQEAMRVMGRLEAKYRRLHRKCLPTMEFSWTRNED